VAGSGRNRNGVSGINREILAPETFAVTERSDEACRPGEALLTYALVERGGKTTQRSRCAMSRGRPATSLKSPMEQGVTMSYERQAELLAALEAAGMEQAANKL